MLLSDLPETFKFALVFYPYDTGAKKKMLTFTCEEEKPRDDRSSTARRESTMIQAKPSLSKEFEVVYVFERMLSTWWQKTLEQKLQVYKTVEVSGQIVPDCF